MIERQDRPSEHTMLKLFGGDLPPAEATALHRALRTDAEARRRYDRLVQAERALEGHRDTLGLGAGAQQRVAQRLFAPAPKPRPGPAMPWMSVAWAAATAMVAVGLLTPLTDRPSADNAFVSRGAEPTALSSDRVLQVLRVSVDAEGAVHVEPANALHAGDQLRFAAFARNEPWRLSIVAVRSDGHRRVLSRRDRIAPTPSARRVDVAFTVPSGWRGPTQFVGVFERSESPANLSTLDLRARDRTDLSLRVVHATISPPIDRPEPALR